MALCWRHRQFPFTALVLLTTSLTPAANLRLLVNVFTCVVVCVFVCVYVFTCVVVCVCVCVHVCGCVCFYSKIHEVLSHNCERPLLRTGVNYMGLISRMGGGCMAVAMWPTVQCRAGSPLLLYNSNLHHTAICQGVCEQDSCPLWPCGRDAIKRCKY